MVLFLAASLTEGRGLEVHVVARPAVFHLGEVGRVLLSKVGKPALEALRRALTREAVGDGDLDRLDGRVHVRTVARRGVREKVTTRRSWRSRKARAGTWQL